jgi:hypothetical protein
MEEREMRRDEAWERDSSQEKNVAVKWRMRAAVAAIQHVLAEVLSLLELEVGGSWMCSRL